MAAHFPRFLTIDEAAQRLGVSAARISMWVGECKLPVAARSEYAGFLLRTVTVETIGCDLAGELPPEGRSQVPTEVPRRRGRARARSAGPQPAARAEPNGTRNMPVT